MNTYQRLPLSLFCIFLVSKAEALDLINNMEVLKSEIDNLHLSISNTISVFTWLSAILLGVMAIFIVFAGFLVIREDLRVAATIKNHQERINIEWGEIKDKLNTEVEQYISKYEKKLDTEIQYTIRLVELRMLFDHGERESEVIYPLITYLTHPPKIFALPLLKRVLSSNISEEINLKIKEGLKVLEENNIQ